MNNQFLNYKHMSMEMQAIGAAQREATQTMTSREIAEQANKRHDHVLDAIRKMEPAWIKAGRPNFRETSYIDQSNRQQRQYELTKTECLYIATKFNDEARAKLVLRWEELENEKRESEKQTIQPVLLPTNKELALMVIRAEEEKEQLLLTTQLQEKELKESAPKVEYHDKVLSSSSLFAVTQIAKELGLSAVAFNKTLKEKGIQYKVGDQWVLYSKYAGLGYTKTKTHIYSDSSGAQRTTIQTYWTEKGRKFLHSIFNTQIALQIA